MRNELLTNIKDSKEILIFIDMIERLGCGYHFEEEIQSKLQEVYNEYEVDCFKDDLHYTSLRFRLLRYHGFCLSCGKDTQTYSSNFYLFIYIDKINQNRSCDTVLEDKRERDTFFGQGL